MDKNTQICQKLIIYIQKIFGHCENIDKEEFFNNIDKQELCAFSLIQMAELSKNLDDDFIEEKNIPQNQLRALRNRLVHNYDGIDFTVVWEVIEINLPELI
ncbi:hypothetical protein FACS1894132_12490 [Clostridia bacterium]|nr:hypothetical protein FACS1894132_12490 [Clostridia bacterium]